MKKYWGLFCLMFVSIFSYAQTLEVWMERADVAERTGNMEVADICYKKVIDLDSFNCDAFYGRGNVLSNLGRTRGDKLVFLESFEMFQKASELEPSNPYVYTNWAATMLQLAKMENNLSFYQNKIALLCQKSVDLGDQIGAYNLACLYSLLNNKKKSFEWLEKTLMGDYKIKVSSINRNQIENESDFKNIKRDKRFDKLLLKYSLMNQRSFILK